MRTFFQIPFFSALVFSECSTEVFTAIVNLDLKKLKLSRKWKMALVLEEVVVKDQLMRLLHQLDFAE